MFNVRTHTKLGIANDGHGWILTSRMTAYSIARLRFQYDAVTVYICYTLAKSMVRPVGQDSRYETFAITVIHVVNLHHKSPVWQFK